MGRWLEMLLTFTALSMKWSAIPKSGEMNRLKVQITLSKLHLHNICVKQNKVCSYFIRGPKKWSNNKVSKSETKFSSQFTWCLPCINTCTEYYEYLFVSLVAVLFAGVLITKVYLPVVIMKAQLLCGMLSQDPKLDHFR